MRDRSASGLSAADERFMRRALALAARGRGTTRPNPTVGTVIVRGGRILAEGFHRRAGEAHAEVNALTALGGDARGATLYVTLEPCCHFGRTGPCTEAILEARARTSQSRRTRRAVRLFGCIQICRRSSLR